MTRIMPRRSRRTLLKGLAVTLPAAWSRPVVETVLLPAHAQTSELLPPVSTESTDLCGVLLACMPGVDPAIDGISVQNLSGNNITITSIAFSNPNHSYQGLPVLPVVIPGNACQLLVVTDSSLLCGNTISDGVATLFFDGFASIDVDLPTM